MTEQDSANAGQLGRTRSVTTTILVILASLGVVLSLVGAWVRTTLFDTESFMQVVDSTLASEEVITALGDALSEQTITALDIEGRLETRLVAVDVYLAETLADVLDLSSAQRALLARVDLPRFANLAGPIAEPIEQRIEEAIDSLVASESFQEILPDAIAFAHRGAVALIRDNVDDLENVSVVAGEVRWNILPLVGRAIGNVFDEGILDPVIDSLNLSAATYSGVREEAVARLSEALGTVLPADFGQVTIISEERLAAWQGLARTLDRAVILTIVLTVALLAIALALSNNRRRTLVQFAIGSVVALLAAGVVQRNVLEAVNEAIPGPPEQAAARVFFDALFANLRAIALVFVVVALVVGLSAHLAGRPAWLQALRRRDSAEGRLARIDRVVNTHSDGFIAGGIAAALFVWWRVGLNPTSFIVVSLLLGSYLWYVSRLAIRGDVPDTSGS